MALRMRRAAGLSSLVSSLRALGHIGWWTAQLRSQPECPSRLICRDRRCTTGVEVGQPLVSDPTVFEVDHRFVSLNELGWHDRSSALVIAATSDVGDLATEGSPVHGVGEVIPRLAD